MMGGKISFAFSSFGGALPFTADNRVRPLAVTSLTRSTGSYADLPTMDEEGLKGFEVELWDVILAPAAVPADVLARLNDALVKTLARPELKAAFAKIGAEPVPTTQQDGAAFQMA